MMLLSAVLMIFAFLALTAMVARVAQLGSMTTSDQDRPLLLEIDVVETAVDETVAGIKAAPGMCPNAGVPAAPTCKQKFIDALDGSLDHLRHLEATRGFDLQWRIVDGSATDGDNDGFVGTTVTACSAASPSPARYVAYTLDDGEVQVSLRAAAAFTYAC